MILLVFGSRFWTDRAAIQRWLEEAIRLRLDRVAAVQVGCYRCEQPPEEALGRPCPGDPSETAVQA